MGRDVAGLRGSQKPSSLNTKSNSQPHENVEDYEPQDHVGKIDQHLHVDKGDGSLQEEHSRNDAEEEVLSTNLNEKGSISLETTKPDSDIGIHSFDSGESPVTNDLHKSLPNSPSISTKQQKSQGKKAFDDNENLLMMNKSKVTVPVAPKFVIENRLERRKEFYTKLEEKHNALEKERLDHEAKMKEEEEAAIRQLRKNMVYRANPVPSFYREGRPPPKTEVKKLPVTRAKSPNLTRRKSFGDASESRRSGPGTTRHHSGVPKASSFGSKAKTSKMNDNTKVDHTQESQDIANDPPEPCS